MTQPNTTYANGRRMFDSDSHLMETLNWLSSYAKPEQAGLIGALATESGGAKLIETIAAAEARRADAAATAKLLEQPLISGPKGWHAYGAFDPAERSRALDLLGFEKQLVFPTFSIGQFARSSRLEKVYAGTDMLNRRMADFCRNDPRLLPVGYVPLKDPKLALAAVQDGIADGIRAFWVSSDPVDGRSPSHVDHDPIWDLLQARRRADGAAHRRRSRPRQGLPRRGSSEGEGLARRRREPARQGFSRGFALAAEFPDGADLRPGVPAFSEPDVRRHRNRRDVGAGFSADTRSGPRVVPQIRAAARRTGAATVGVFPQAGSRQPVPVRRRGVADRAGRRRHLHVRIGLSAPRRRPRSGRPIRRHARCRANAQRRARRVSTSATSRR